MGNEMLIHSKINDKKIVVRSETRYDIKTDDKINISFKWDKIHVFNNETGMNLRM
jgi:ABC-type sugar transport system ATPase subunit